MTSTNSSVNLNESKTSEIIGLGVFIFIIVPVAIFLRLWARKIAKQELWWDDWFCIACVPFALLSPIFDLVQVARDGWGRHMALVKPEQLVDYAKLLYILLLFYNIGLALFKLSFLAFYVRVFPVIRWLKVSSYVLGTLIILWVLATEFLLAFRCHPVNLAWEGTPEQQAAGCISEPVAFTAQAVPTIVFDIIIFLMPVKLVWRLQMKMASRILVIGIFLLGFLVTIISCVRLAFTWTSSNADLTYGLVEVGQWSQAEPVVGIICCSLLTYGPLIRAFQQKMGWSTTSKPAACIKKTPNTRKPVHGSMIGYVRHRSSDQFELRELAEFRSEPVTGRIEADVESMRFQNRIYVQREVEVRRE